jgi:hypothetical protein
MFTARYALRRPSTGLDSGLAGIGFIGQKALTIYFANS